MLRYLIKYRELETHLTFTDISSRIGLKHTFASRLNIKTAHHYFKLMGHSTSKLCSNPVTQQVYQYQQLNSALEEIRLLVIQPGSFESPIQCNLEPVSIASASRPDYEAASYVWDDRPSSLCPILIDGRILNVPASCARVLRSVRLARKSRALCIDSICINHQDALERRQQVAMLNRIYSKSTGNVIWLGKADGTVEV